MALLRFVDAVFISLTVSGIASGLLMTSFDTLKFVFYRRNRRRGPGLAIFIARNLLIDLTRILPEFLDALDRREAVAL